MLDFVFKVEYLLYPQEATVEIPCLKFLPLCEKVLFSAGKIGVARLGEVGPKCLHPSGQFHLKAIRNPM